LQRPADRPRWRRSRGGDPPIGLVAGVGQREAIRWSASVSFCERRGDASFRFAAGFAATRSSRGGGRPQAIGLLVCGRPQAIGFLVRGRTQAFGFDSHCGREAVHERRD
jgi:hypothetical protein